MAGRHSAVQHLNRESLGFAYVSIAGIGLNGWKILRVFVLCLAGRIDLIMSKGN